MMTIEEKAPIRNADKAILRDLAARYAELAAASDAAEKKRLWRAHNALRQEHPMLIHELEEPIWRETGPEQLCEDDEARGIEWNLRRSIWQAENLDDDTIHEPVYRIPLRVRSSGSGIETQRITSGEAGGSVAFGEALRPGDDPERIRLPVIEVDHEASRREQERLQDVLGDASAVKPVGNSNPWFTPLDTLAEWRGVQNLMMDLVDHAEWIHAICARLLEAQLCMLDQLEAQGGLSANNGSERVGSGGLGTSDELNPGDPVLARQMWGMAAAQVFSGVSPAMREEFCLPYESQWLARFGLGCYGCCEVLHEQVDALRRIPNLRRISMSPWVDMRKAAEAVGRAFIFSRKPNPAVEAGEGWDPEAARASIRSDLEAAAGCNVELIMRTCRTCRNDPRRVTEWTRIAREEIERATGG
jgi:hypothetical protein